MSAEPTRLTDDDRRKLTHIPDSVETRDVLEYLLFDLFIRGILTDDNLRQIIRKLIGKKYIQSKGPDDLESLK
jgi:hypothetical protein